MVTGEGNRMQPLKLLVVEDNLASLELMTEVFTSLKAEVRPISDSEKAVGAVNQEKFDGIFLDLEMPKSEWFRFGAPYPQIVMEQIHSYRYRDRTR